MTLFGWRGRFACHIAIAFIQIGLIAFISLCEFGHAHDSIVIRQVDQPNALGIASDFPNIPHAGAKDHAVGGHEHDFIRFPDLMERDGRPVFLRDFDANDTLARS